jgi:dipeptidyl aminopeptidase/acylaminoacyl peptidase
MFRNAGNLGHRLGHFERLMDAMDVNIFAIHYRGYGPSTGRSTERGLKQDASAALEYLLQSRQDIDASKIIAYGHSLGTVD